jgi:hypothetical protein
VDLAVVKAPDLQAIAVGAEVDGRQKGSGIHARVSIALARHTHLDGSYRGSVAFPAPRGLLPLLWDRYEAHLVVKMRRA